MLLSIVNIHLSEFQKNLPPYNYIVPNDFSSASFFIALALIVENSEILIKNVNLNPLRTGFLKVVINMGADVTIVDKTLVQGEEVGDILVKSSKTQGICVPDSLVPSMIDEFPILSIVAAMSDGKTEFRGILDLRNKESDRIHSIVYNLKKIGIKVEEKDSSIIIYGEKCLKEGGVDIDSFLDHRIAMSFLVLGSVCKKPLKIKGCDSINTSFPNFFEIAKNVGMNIF